MSVELYCNFKNVGWIDSWERKHEKRWKIKSLQLTHRHTNNKLMISLLINSFLIETPWTCARGVVALIVGTKMRVEREVVEWSRQYRVQLCGRWAEVRVLGYWERTQASTVEIQNPHQPFCVLSLQLSARRWRVSVIFQSFSWRGWETDFARHLFLKMTNELGG